MQKLYQAVTTYHVKSFVQVLSLCVQKWHYHSLYHEPSYYDCQVCARHAIILALHENIIQQKSWKRISACETIHTFTCKFIFAAVFLLLFFEILQTMLCSSIICNL